MGAGGGPGRLAGAKLRPPELEAEFRARYLRSDGRTAAVIAGGLTLLAAAFIATDAHFVGPPTIWILLGLRLAQVAITVALIRAALRSPTPAVLDAWCLAWVGWAALVIVTVQSTRPAGYLLPVMSDLLLLISAWTLLPNRFVLQALGAAIVTGGSLTWMIAFRDRPSLPVLLLLGNTLVAANLAAGFVSWRFQRTRRLHFLAEKELADLVVQLRESRERLQSVLDVSTDGYWERDLVTGMVLHSGRMNEITGRPALDTVVGTDDWRGRMHPDDLREIGPAYDAAMASREGHFDRVFRTRHADGTWRWVRSRGGVSARDPSGKPLRIAGTISDVQAQKEAEDAFRDLIEHLQAGVVVHEADTSIRFSNAKAGELLGLTQDQMRGKAAIDQVVGVDRPAPRDRAWVLVSGYPVHRGPGSIDHVVVTFVDITARKQAEDALQRSEALQRAVMENFPNGLVGLFDRDLRYVLIDGTNTITATSPRDWKGRTLQELTPAEVLPMIEPAYRAALQGESRRVQLPLGGHVIDVLLEPVRDGSGAVTHGLFMTQDVTEKRALEERLVVASRLASLGTLVAGVAHEINNPLTGELAGQGFAIEEIERVKEAIGPGGPADRSTIVRRLDEALDALRDAQAGGQRIARVVKDLSTFGRPDPQRSRVRLMDVVDEAMRFLPATVSGAAAIRVENLGVPEVLASAGQIGQVLVNLVSNGSRAMAGKEKGTVRITVGPGSPGMALIEVADDGRGMPPEVLARIFDPFFTTRKAGEGMGLGLPICHSIVTAHGGTISARSEPGKGSVFRVELPAAADQA